MSKLFFSSPTLTTPQVHLALQTLNLPTLGVQVRDHAFAYELPEAFALSTSSLHERLSPIAQTERFDFAVLKPELTKSDFKLLAMDMDSTLITIECIDEIADFVGKKKEVAAITEATMRGDIPDFAQSLTQRVALLKDVPERVLETVFNERLELSDGAQKLIAYAKYCGWKTLLVSGGFHYFTDRLKTQLKLDFTQANTLEIVNGHLTGKVLGPIVDGQGKRNAVLRTCKELGCEPAHTLAIGDGANDLPMMEVAGVSVAYRAKPTVQEKTTYQINHGGLDTVAKWFETHA